MSKNPTHKETFLELKNILQDGLQDVRHEIRDEYQRAIHPVVEELSEIRETVIRIDEREKLSQNNKKEVIAYTDKRFNTLWKLGAGALVASSAISLFLYGLNLSDVTSLKEQVALLERKSNYTHYVENYSPDKDK